MQNLQPTFSCLGWVWVAVFPARPISRGGKRIKPLTKNAFLSFEGRRFRAL
jgi:hypothetical protein